MKNLEKLYKQKEHFRLCNRKKTPESAAVCVDAGRGRNGGKNVFNNNHDGALG